MAGNAPNRENPRATLGSVLSSNGPAEGHDPNRPKCPSEPLRT